MDHNQPIVVIEGMDEIIQHDLEKHRTLLERSKNERLSYVQARSHEIRRKKNWAKLIGGGKYDDDALREGLDQASQNIAMYSDKVKLSDDAIAHHTLIVDTLSAQLEDYHDSIAALARSRSNSNANPDRLD